MRNTAFQQKKTTKYLIWTFLIAWVLQVVVAALYHRGLTIVGRLVMAVMMFAPLLGVLLSGAGLPGMGWKPRFKGNGKFLVAAWLLPMLLTVVGAALYFLVFPGHFDLSGSYITAIVGPEALEQLEAQGLTYPLYLLVSAVASTTYAPLINMFFAVGEEAGWRGFLYPQLKARFGKRKGWLIGGVIWAVWHWPAIWLIGYEYGTDYVGFPVVGMLLFCLIAFSLGVLCDWLYEKTGCIWIPSLFHGAVNASGALPLTACITGTGSAILLGPAPVGLIAGLPSILLAAWLFKAAKAEPAQGEQG